MTVAEAQALWQPDGVYCNTASFGLPPTPAYDALQAALGAWRAGRTSWEGWQQTTDDARAVFAALVGVATERVAVAGAVSQLMGSAVSALAPGARVVVPDVEFTSTLYPLLVQSRLDVVLVAPADLASAVAAGCDAVAFSVVQMSDGSVTDVAAVLDAAEAVGAWVFADGTQAVGWLPVDASRFDALCCAAYKWLAAPRGSAFMAVSDRLLERAVPGAAGWYAAEDVMRSFYGPPLALATSARRLDVSPAWFVWVATLPALQVLADVGIAQIHAHDLALAHRFADGIGIARGDSAIVTAEVPGGLEKLADAGIVASVRGGRLRVSFHLYNTAADVDRMLDVLS